MSKYKQHKILIVFGTRPEFIKLVPVIREFKKCPENFQLLTISTAQHREMLATLFKDFNITPDLDLGVMKSNQSLSQITSNVMLKLEESIVNYQPDLLLVQGDTSTAYAAALVGFYNRVPVGHVEAGLRSHNINEPFPEEMNRVFISKISTLNFAPTETAAQNLINEKITPDKIFITGNTVVDSLKLVLGETDFQPLGLIKNITDTSDKILLLTIHRRETWGDILKEICEAISEIISIHSDISLVFPVHPNPAVRKVANEIFKNQKRVHLLEPLDYHNFVHLMKNSKLILTDSGGVQEEAPYLGKRVLVLRSLTDRPESVECGLAKIIGRKREDITREVNYVINNNFFVNELSESLNIYGDGRSAENIINIIRNFFKC